MARWFFRSLNDMLDQFPNLLFDGGQTLIAVHHFNPGRFLPGERKISLPDAVIEIERLIFHAVEQLPAAGAFEANARVEVNNEREVGPAGANGKFIDEANRHRVKLTAGTLVHGCGIKESVCNHNLAGSQGWLNDFANELGAAGAK